MRLDLRQLFGTPIVAGALDGKAALATMLDQVRNEPSEPEPVFLDFRGIDVATVSFLRESVLAFRNFVRGSGSAFYPVVANANSSVRDELVELVRPRNDVLMTCRLDEAGDVLSAAPLGDLDPKQRITFDLVHQRGETDAAELMRLHGKEEKLKHSTAWNNRLTTLSALGLIVEIKQGRSKRYRPIFSEVKHGF